MQSDLKTVDLYMKTVQKEKPRLFNSPRILIIHDNY